MQTQARDADRALAMPWWLDWTAGLFPVILLVFVLRSFLFEPFHIPSGSMIPTLWIGDLVLVNKFTYGLRLPVAGTRLTAGTPIARGDVVVFHYPLNPSENYIKRVVGLPGDVVTYVADTKRTPAAGGNGQPDDVTYVNKRLTVNGQPVPETPAPDFFDESTTAYYKQFSEQLGTAHDIITRENYPAYINRDGAVRNFQYRDNCKYTDNGFTCKVPAGHYFMMGDNRDDSDDSRYWGFVPEANVVGRAFLIWMNLSHLGRIGFFK
jgi:signal peptidase I